MLNSSLFCSDLGVRLPHFLNNFTTLFLILTQLFIGLMLPKKPSLSRYIDAGLGGLVYVILALIGVELAQIEGLLSQLPVLVGYVSVLAGLTIGFGVLALMALDTWLPWQKPTRKTAKLSSHATVSTASNASTPPNLHSAPVSIEGSLKQMACVAVGFAIGKALPSAWLPPEQSMTALLMLLILLVGMSLKASGITIKEVLITKRGVHTSVVFTLSVLLAGVVFAVMFDEVSLPQGLALASGFGWYSLSAIVMTDAYGAVWGSVALFNDLLREFVALACIPLLMRRYPSSAVGLGGATSLDFTLPVIQASGGIGVVPLAISFGFIINIVSPVLMVLFSSLG